MKKCTSFLVSFKKIFFFSFSFLDNYLNIIKKFKGKSAAVKPVAATSSMKGGLKLADFVSKQPSTARGPRLTKKQIQEIDEENAFLEADGFGDPIEGALFSEAFGAGSEPPSKKKRLSMGAQAMQQVSDTLTDLKRIEEVTILNYTSILRGNR